jgi:hypothetical protein
VKKAARGVSSTGGVGVRLSLAALRLLRYFFISEMSQRNWLEPTSAPEAILCRWEGLENAKDGKNPCAVPHRELEQTLM